MKKALSEMARSVEEMGDVFIALTEEMNKLGDRLGALNDYCVWHAMREESVFRLGMFVWNEGREVWELKDEDYEELCSFVTFSPPDDLLANCSEKGAGSEVVNTDPLWGAGSHCLEDQPNPPTKVEQGVRGGVWVSGEPRNHRV